MIVILYLLQNLYFGSTFSIASNIYSSVTMCACLFHDRVKGVNMMYMEAEHLFFFLVCVSFFEQC